MKKLDKLKDYCSPSRLNCYMESKRKFLQTYLFKSRPKSTKAQEEGKINHEFLYSIVNDDGKDMAIEPTFGHQRKTETTSSDEAKKNREKKEKWRKENSGKQIVSLVQYNIFVALKVAFNTEPVFKKALVEAVKNNFQGIEKVIYDKELKIKGVLDIIAIRYLSCLDIKTTFKSNFLNEGAGKEFFKYEEFKKCIQGVFYTEILNRKFNSFFHFNWLVVCNSYPFGNKLLAFKSEYFEDVRKVIFSKGGYLDKYKVFCDKVKQIIGYDFFLIEEYKGDLITDWTKLSIILDSFSEEVEPSTFARYQMEEMLKPYNGMGV